MHGRLEMHAGSSIFKGVLESGVISVYARRQSLAKADASRRGGRVVEGTGLENRRAGNRTVGSNPTPSATPLYISIICGTDFMDAIALALTLAHVLEGVSPE